MDDQNKPLFFRSRGTDLVRPAPDEGMAGVLGGPDDSDALSLAPVEPGSAGAASPLAVQSLLSRALGRVDLILLALLLLGAGALVISGLVSRNKTPAVNNVVGSEFGTVQLPLEDFLATEDGLNLSLGSVKINGALRLNQGVIIAPSVQPNAPTAGQLYFDQNTSQLAYYSGTQFVPLGGGTDVSSIGGLTGQVAIGGGLNAAGGQLNNTGVLSLQGQTGNITLAAGNGISIAGTTISNTGVVSLVSASPALTVTTDGNGNYTLTGSGAGTVASSGGAAGTLPLFTGAQNIENSIVTQSGGTLTVGGNVAATGSLSLGAALSVSNGGTGVSALTGNGVLIGNGVAAVTSLAAGGSGLCLMSTAGAPTWAACPGGGGGVTSVDGLTGVLDIANATGVGSTITIDDATTAAKGIASFNATNFSVVGGAVNTIQNINTTATPTFTGVSTNSITPSAALTVGVSGQTALLQGSTTTITSNGAGNDIILNSADTIELQDNTNVTGNVTASGDLAVNGGDLTSTGGLNITPGGALTVGASGQSMTLQGNASTTLRATNGGNTTIVGFVSPTANTTLNFPALGAGSYTICTDSGNCAGAGVTLQAAYNNSTSPEIVLDATRAAFTIRDNASAIGGNLLEVQSNSGATTYLAVTATGVAVTGTMSATGAINTSGGVIQTNGTTRIDNTGNLTNIASLTASGNGAFQGGSMTLGASLTAGSLIINDGSGNTGTIQVAALGQDTVYTLPNPGGGTATICLDSGNCAGQGGAVAGSGTNNRISKFTATGSTIGDSTISDDGTTVTTSVDLIIQGGQATIGVANSQTGSLSFAHGGSGFMGTITQTALSTNRTYNLPNADGDICLSSGNCLGGGGGGANTSLNNLTSVAINTTLLPGVAGGVNLGSGTLPFGDLFVSGSSGTPGTNNFRITGASTTGTRVITLPDASGTVCLQSSANCGFAPASGSANYIQNQSAIDQVGATFRIDGDGRAATFNGTTGLNTGSGSGTQRIDASGNLVNIGNLSALGAITISSTGGGNDIILSSADTIELQGNTNVTGNIVASGDIAANGGDITSSGALNITPGGTLTAGSTTQTFTLQGNAGSTITATGGGFTTTIGFSGTPVGNVTFEFDRSVAAGTYQICTSANNCAGVAATIQTAYNASTNPELVVDSTRGALTVRDNASALGANLLEVQSNNGANTYFGVSATGLTTSGDLALNGGDLTSSGALNITPGGALIVGSTTQTATLQGNASSTITATNGASTTTVSFQTPTANVNYRFATASAGNYDICTSAGNCPGVATTLQGAYNASTNPELVVDATRGALTVRDNSSAIGANLLEVQDNAGSTTYFAVTANGASATGVLSATTALQAPLLDTASAVALNIGTANATAINLNQSVVVAAGRSLTVTGGNTASRPGSPTEGMMYFDTDTDRMLVYSNGKWQADRSTATKIVAMGPTTGCSGSTPTASQNYDAADFVSTSCTSAQTTINAAIAALPAAGGSVYLMEGAYIVDGSISLPNNVMLHGAGGNTVLKLRNGINANIDLITNTDTSNGTNVTIRNLKLDGNQANNSSGTQNGMLFSDMGASVNLPGVRVDTVTITEFRNGGLYFNASDGGGNSIITNSMFINNDARDIYASVSNNVTITNNIFQGGDGVAIIAGTSSVITDNSFIGGIDGIYNQRDNVTVANNLFQDNTGQSIMYDFALGGVIADNVLLSNTGAVAISLTSADDNTVTGNTLVDNTGGIVLYDSSNNIVANNRVSNTGGSTDSGINITFGASNNTITGNVITDTAGTGFAINIDNTTEVGNYMSDNRFSGTGAASINDAGTGTIYASQLNSSGDLVSKAAAIVLQGTVRVSTLGAATANAVAVCRDSSTTNLIACDANTTGAPILQGGNSFGAAANIGTNDAFDVNIRRGGTTQLTVGNGTVTLASGADLLLQGANAYISNTQGQTDSESFGANANVTASRSIAIGRNSTVGFNDSIGFGYNTSVAGNNSIAIGSGASSDSAIAIGISASAVSNSVIIGNSSTSGSGSVVGIGMSLTVNGASSTAIGFSADVDDFSVAVGAASSANAQNAVAIGAGATSDQQYSIALGRSSTVTAQRQFVVGGSAASSAYINNVYFGSGVTDAAPQGVTIQGTGGSGTDVAGASVNIAGGRGTGTANGGNLNFQVTTPGVSSNATLNNLATVFSLSGTNGAATFQNNVDSNAAVQIQTAAGTETLLSANTLTRSVGTAGNIVKIGNSTGTDTALTVLQLDAVSANPTTNLASLSGGMFYNSSTNKVSIIENGVIKELCNKTDLLCGAAATTTLQNAYDDDVNGSDVVISLTTADDSLIVRNPSSSGTDSGYTMLVDQLNTGAVDGLRISSVGTGALLKVTDATATSADVLTIADGGATTFKSQSNSSSAFRVINASNLPLFTVDTSGSLVYVGDPTDDAADALLVLDGVSGSDPGTGVAGAMYYNTDMGAFRCYVGTSWRYCNEPESLSQGYNLEEDFIVDDGNSTPGLYHWFPATTGASGAGAGTATPDVGTRPGQILLETGTSTGGTAAIFLEPDSAERTFVAGGEIIEMAANLAVLSDGTNPYDVRLGLCDENTTDCTDGVYFEYDHNTSANWRYATANNTTRTKNSSTKAVVTGWVMFRIVISSGAGNATYYVRNAADSSWTNLGTISTNIPTASTRPNFNIIKGGAGSANRTMRIDYFQMRNQYTSPR